MARTGVSHTRDLEDVVAFLAQMANKHGRSHSEQGKWIKGVRYRDGLPPVPRSNRPRSPTSHPKRTGEPYILPSMGILEPNKVHEIETAEASKDAAHAWTKPFGPEWGSHYWGKWQTIAFALYNLGVERGSSILDVGAGVGWTTIFLAESGFCSVGVDIAPAHIEVATQRAARFGSTAEFLVQDMEALALDRSFDGALVFDALHHSLRPAQVVGRVAAHLRPGGWVLFAEPSWLHDLSPGARRVSKQMGWVEKGVRVRSLKRHCGAAGLGNFRRFYEGTAPYGGGVRDLAWQAARLMGARLSTAPQMSVWVAAQKL